MKKIVAILITVVMTAAFCLPVMAEPGSFVSSPSKEQAPEIIESENESPDCTATLTITAYADRSRLDAEACKTFESAYTTILGAEKLNELNSAIVNMAEDAGFDLSDLSVSDLFDISCDNCDGHEAHGTFRIKLKPEDLEGFVCLIHYVDGIWKIVENARVTDDGTVLEFEEDDFSPFAIIRGDASSDIVPPTVDDEEGLSPLANALIGALVGAAVGAGVTAGVFGIVKHVKKKKA